MTFANAELIEGEFKPFPGSEALVVEAEARLGRRLPPDLRNRLIVDNGGEINAMGESWLLFPVWDPTNRKTMARTADHVVRENEALRREWKDALPPGYLTVAENGGGDYLVLAPGRDDVLAWDHETGEARPVTVDWRPFIGRRASRDIRQP